MPFSRFFKRRRFDDAANALYLALVEQSRQPVFYRDLGVADTLEGRYDMIILHAYLLFRRLGKLEGEDARAVSQQTFDFMFTDMDQNLREMGVTDMGVGKRVQRMAEAFYGRTAAYDKALGEEGRALQHALGRNLYQGAAVPPEVEDRMAAYVRAQIAHLEGQGEAAMLAGTISFIQPQALAQ
ncbi:ubiquinol-cytochrome C chaperone family protein [Magnetospirillum sulfuroxidans]|uniref:Ubiquinol-cytochrome C chaperone family protein n=1 Tax=Magnetospirillum sulfuroxidans TaxID=611300 RepID=A0ABS5I822_9PROT|nr:ubiquinol-cytochrome C chaperone family protein [Magnetospirillum sulfuroxidans]MBR9970588.1 ubiquinol-cytochrome C chaperone family protein [Magnetospirillum sulfuroxidans]